jgi:hypothetical protein
MVYGWGIFLVNVDSEDIRLGVITNLVRSTGIAQIKNLDVAFGRSDDKDRELDVHSITALGQLNGRNWARRPEVPVLKRISERTAEGVKWGAP